MEAFNVAAPHYTYYNCAIRYVIIVQCPSLMDVFKNKMILYEMRWDKVKVKLIFIKIMKLLKIIYVLFINSEIYQKLCLCGLILAG